MKKISSVLILLMTLSLSHFAHAQGKFKRAVKLQILSSRLMQDPLDKVAEKLWRDDVNQVEQRVNPFEIVNALKYYTFDLKLSILKYLSSPSDRCLASQGYAFDTEVLRDLKKEYRKYQLEQVNRYLPQFIELPEVTLEDVQDLQRAQASIENFQTSIHSPMPAFKAADVKTPIGLYRAVMGSYPDLKNATWMDDAQRAAVLEAWKANPDLPLTHTNSDEDVIFADRLSKLTGRKFTVMSDPQNEYMRRGRTDDTALFSAGSITTTKYHFGDNDDEVKNHAFISTNPLNEGRPHGVHEIPLFNLNGSVVDPNNYKNARGFFHPIGLAYERNSSGIVRGGTFKTDEWGAISSASFHAFSVFRYAHVSSRLAEAY